MANRLTVSYAGFRSRRWKGDASDLLLEWVN